MIIKGRRGILATDTEGSIGEPWHWGNYLILWENSWERKITSDSHHCLKNHCLVNIKLEKRKAACKFLVVFSFYIFFLHLKSCCLFFLLTISFHLSNHPLFLSSVHPSNLSSFHYYSLFLVVFYFCRLCTVQSNLIYEYTIVEF